jgi:hypothetical protein
LAKTKAVLMANKLVSQWVHWKAELLGSVRVVKMGNMMDEKSVEVRVKTKAYNLDLNLVELMVRLKDAQTVYTTAAMTAEIMVDEMVGRMVVTKKSRMAVE